MESVPAFHAFALIRARCLLHEPGGPERCAPAAGSLLCPCKVEIIRVLHGVILKIKGSAMCVKPLIIILTTATTSIAALLQIAKHLLSPRPWVKCTQVSHPAPEILAGAPVIVFHPHRRRRSLREVKQLARDHTARRARVGGPDQFCVSPEPEVSFSLIQSFVCWFLHSPAGTAECT